MRLYLVQHGEAVSEEIDPSRPLTEKGKVDVSKMAGFLKETNLKINVIWHSTKRRARETAQILDEILGSKEGIFEKEGLAPNDPVGRWKKEFEIEKRDIMVVGHLPFLQKLVSLFLVGSETHELIEFHQGGVVCLERKENGKWRLVLAITPEVSGIK
jgi:phosphohistidine phosphatase